MAKLTIDLDSETVAYLSLLSDESNHWLVNAKHALEHLAARAAEGVSRPGAWEHDWIMQAFAEELVDMRIYCAQAAGTLTTNDLGHLVWQTTDHGTKP